MKGNMMTEYLPCPAEWTLDPDRYTWLGESELRALDAFGFDYGDILKCHRTYMDERRITAVLATTVQELDEYCQLLWRKPWAFVHQCLVASSQGIAVDEIFDRWAREGNATAMSILSNSIIKFDEDANKKDMTIRIVNDLSDPDDDQGDQG